MVETSPRSRSLLGGSRSLTHDDGDAPRYVAGVNTNPVSERLEAELDRVAEERLGRFRAETGGPGTFALASTPNLRVVERNGREVCRAYVEWPQVQADGRTTSGEARIVFVETPAWLK